MSSEGTDQGCLEEMPIRTGAARGGAAFKESVVAAAKNTISATRKSAAKEEERRKAIPARVRGVAGSTNSSVVVCDLKTGVCCVGDQCFIG